MRRAAMFVFAVLLAAVPAMAQQGKAASSRRTPESPANAGDVEAQSGPREKVRATKYEIDVTFEPEKAFLRAKATVTLLVLEKTDAIEFELNPRLAISEIADARGRKLEFTRSGRIGSAKLLVRLAEPVDPSDCKGVALCTPAPGVPVTDKPGLKTITLAFTYEGMLPPKPLDYITKDGILLRDESRWYPAVDLSAFTTNEICVQLPAGWMSEVSAPWTDWDAAAQTWRTTPVSSRSLVAIPERYKRLLDHAFDGRSGAGHRSMQTTLKTEHLMGPAGRVLNSMQRLIGEFRHASFSVVHGFPGQSGVIGYSAPGFLVVSEDVVKHYGEANFPPEFFPHEIAHQWFPIEVTLKSEADGWLAESLAEYLAWRYLAEKEPEQARRMVERAIHEATAQEPLRPLSLGLKMFALEGWDMTHAALYSRGMLVWRTLETVIDRERVDRALREYYKSFRGQSASIDDFRRICEEISGRDLKWFFDYYIAGTRLPEIEIRRVSGNAPGEFAGEIVVRNVPPEFQVRVEMFLQTARGLVEHSVATRGEVTPFTVNVPDTVTRVVVDPRQRILRKR